MEWWSLLKTPLLRIAIHKVYPVKQTPHTHPYKMFSFLIKGFYLEKPSFNYYEAPALNVIPAGGWHEVVCAHPFYTFVIGIGRPQTVKIYKDSEWHDWNEVLDTNTWDGGS